LAIREEFIMKLILWKIIAVSLVVAMLLIAIPAMATTAKGYDDTAQTKTSIEANADNLDGYTFDGWFLAPVQYTVTFVDWNETVLKIEQVLSGESAAPPANPVRNGYTFTGWDGVYMHVMADITVKALYRSNGGGGGGGGSTDPSMEPAEPARTTTPPVAPHAAPLVSPEESTTELPNLPDNPLAAIHLPPETPSLIPDGDEPNDAYPQSSDLPCTGGYEIVYPYIAVFVLIIIVIGIILRFVWNAK